MSQCERILRHLQDYGTITQAEAIAEYGCYRLGARVYDLKKQGHPILRRMKTGKNRYNESVSYAEYYMEGQHEQH